MSSFTAQELFNLQGAIALVTGGGTRRYIYFPNNVNILKSLTFDLYICRDWNWLDGSKGTRIQRGQGL